MKKMLGLILLLTTIILNITFAQRDEVHFYLGNTGFERGVFSLVYNNTVFASIDVDEHEEAIINLTGIYLPENLDVFKICFSGSSRWSLPHSSSQECACESTKDYSPFSKQYVSLDSSNIGSDWVGLGCLKS